VSVRLVSLLAVVALAGACKSGGKPSEEETVFRVQEQRCLHGNELDCDTVASRLEAAGKTAAARPYLIKGCRLAQGGVLRIPVQVQKPSICGRAEAAGARPAELYPAGVVEALETKKP
jgi:hypothetical protein